MRLNSLNLRIIVTVNTLTRARSFGLLTTFLLSLTLFLSTQLHAQTTLNEITQKLPSDIKATVFLDGTEQKSLQSGGGSSTSTLVKAENGRFKEFVRLVNARKGEKSYDTTARGESNSKAIKKGEWVLASFFVRAAPGTGSINIRGFIERLEPSWMMVADASIAAQEEWTRVVALGRAETDLPKNSIHLSLHLALQAQTIDVADFVFASFPASTPTHVFPPTELRYSGMDANAPWRAQANQMIEQFRHDNFRVFVLNRDGSPASNKKIDLTLTNLDYELGSMVAELYTQNSETGDKYRKWFKRFFNAATSRIYWADWGWENPKVRDENLASMAKLQAQEIPARGHVLLYPAFRFSPESLNSLAGNKQAFIDRVNQHIDEIVPILRKLGVNEYDVINELRDEEEWLDIAGVDTVAMWYKRVHQLHPEAILYINENSILTDGGNNKKYQDHYYELITALLKKGAPIHGIGMQGHFSGVVTPIEKMWDILDRFAKFGLPIRITEYDSNTRDYASQAQFDTDFYTAMYAHPATVGITRWGFYEPIMWRPLGALVDKNDELKPNAKMYLEWLAEMKNHQHSLSTNKSGRIAFRGAYGEYQVSIEGEGEPFVCYFNEPLIGTPSADITTDPSCTVRLKQ
jgi:endo-1,4-beta-xylanase